MAECTVLLERMRAGDPNAPGELFGMLYPELVGLAAAIFRGQARHHTLQPTALVHEAYLKMVRPGASTPNDRAHFLAVAAKAMRQILVNHARDGAAQKRGGGQRPLNLTMSDALDPAAGRELEVLALDEALEQLTALDERQAHIAELRFFAGLSLEEVAEALRVSLRTVEADWKMAKAFLRGKMDG